ncbi:MAG TPA: glutathione S-transferase [Solimonas sp.]
MHADRHITLYYAANSRAAGVLLLLRELKAEYTLKLLDLQRNEQRSAEYLAINPMGKVPAIVHRGALVTEQVAIYLYLADLYPEAALAPPLGDAHRGPYLRWMAFYGSAFEPAMVDHALKRTPAPLATSPYGDYESVMRALTAQLEQGPYFLGERFSALDLLWGTSINWMLQFGLLPKTPLFEDYAGRIAARAEYVWVKQHDAQAASA